MAKKMPADLKALVKRVNKARDFPTNTTPASRHVQMIGEALAKGQQYPMLSEEPQHCAWSLLSTVAGLYEARTEIDKLTARAEQAEAALSVAQKDAERYRWLRDQSNRAPDETPTVYNRRVTRLDPDGMWLARIIYEEELDTAIDAAMLAHGGAGEGERDAS